MAFYMIAAHELHGSPIGFRILTAEYNKTTITGGKAMDADLESVTKALMNGTEIINIALDSTGKIVGSNGALTRYPVIHGGRLAGYAPLIVLMEQSNGGYIVSDYKGLVVRMDKQEAVRYAQTEGIANGKLVNPFDDTAQAFISSISGEYPKEKVIDEGANAKKIQIKLDMINGRDFKVTDYNQLYMLNLEIEEFKVPSGVTRIHSKGFADMYKLKRIHFPAGIIEIGRLAISNCKSLEELCLPEGLEVLGTATIHNCPKLKRIILPNSFKYMEKDAIMKCPKLTQIEKGKGTMCLEKNHWPHGVRVVTR